MSQAALRFDDPRCCVSLKLTEVLIHDYDLGEKIVTTDILHADQLPLECRNHNSDSWLSSYGNGWYLLDQDNSPRGHSLQKLFTHSYYYDSSSNVIGITPFVAYNPGDRVVCLGHKSGEAAYQMLRVN